MTEPRDRPFRFGLQVAGAPSRREGDEQARRAEVLGFDAILIADHVVDGLLSPLVALASMAAATTRIHLGTFVCNSDFHHPALLARDAATLDLCSDGRFELGIGAGHAAPEYAEIGFPFDVARVRVERLAESVEILRRLFDGESVTFTGAHYSLHGHALFPCRRPALLVGGNGDRVLRTAAAHADIVGFTGLGRTLPDGQRHVTEFAPEQVDAKVALVRAAATAAGRLDPIECNALVQHIAITDDRAAVAATLATRLSVDPALLLATPYLLFGTVEEIVEQLFRARERWGFTYFVTRDADATAPVIDALRRRPTTS